MHEKAGTHRKRMGHQSGCRPRNYDLRGGFTMIITKKITFVCYKCLTDIMYLLYL
jgi:hypothetical protein